MNLESGICKKLQKMQICKFNSPEVQDESQTCGIWLTLSASEYQEINGQVKVTLRTLRKIAHSLTVHAQALEAYIHFTFMYTEDHIFPVLTIKDFINKDNETTTPFKLATGKNIQNCIYVFYFVHVL